MRESEKRIKEILSQEIQISDMVEKRIQDTYKRLGEKKTSRKKSKRVAAAAIAAICLILPGAAYASSKSEFFQAMFGNATKESHDIIYKEVDNGKGGKTTVSIPSKEYVPVDEEKAEESIGKWVMEEPITKQIGSHTLCIESFAYDRNGALMNFTLERKGGVTALAGDDETNLAKGANFTDESDFYFTWESEKGVPGADCIYIDTKRGTPDKVYGYAYIIWVDALEEDDKPLLRIDTYPCARKDLTEDTEIAIEKIQLTDKGQIPVKSLGEVEYSPISLSVDMSKGFELSEEEAKDPFSMKRLEIVYKDGSSYVVRDTESLMEVDNSSYTLGSGTYYKVIFNRLVDVDEIKEIRIESTKVGKTFMADEN